MRTGEVTMSMNVVIAAVITLAAAAAGPARADAMQNDTGIACRPGLRGIVHAADGGRLTGFDHRRSGFGQLPRDAVIECLGDGEALDPL
jgi:hypothetical protein